MLRNNRNWFCATLATLLLAAMQMGCGGSSSTGTTVTLMKISITPASSSVPKGMTQQLTAKGTYSNGTVSDLTSRVAWSVSPASVAKVSAAGLLNSLAQGNAMVTATMTGVSGQASITVQAAALTAVNIGPNPLAIPLGETQQLAATATYSDGSSGDVTNQVNWSTTSSSIVKVSSAGLVQSLAKGSFSVSAASGSVSNSLNGTVGNAVLQSVQVLPTSASIPKGTGQSFTAIAVYSDGTRQDVTGSATWQSTNTGVAPISSSGVASGSTQGSTQITGSYQSMDGNAALTVSAATVKAISVSPSTANFAKGTTLQLAATATLSDGSKQDVTSAVTWSSNQTTVCTVNGSGLAAAGNTGSCSATATSGAVSGSATLTVTPATLTGIALTPPNPSVNSGGSLQMSATGTFTDGSTQDMTSSVTYGSSKPLVATVSASGLLQGLAPGTSTITASSGSVSTSVTATVTAATLQTITIGTGSVTVAAGVSAQLTATGNYSDGSTQDLSATVSWSSSASSVAAVDTTGKVTGLSVGSATITAKLGIVSGTVNVTVTPATIVSININPISVTIAAGQSQAFTATATLTDGSTLDVTASVHWSVANPLLATISNTTGNAGLLTSLIAGNTTVSATLGSVTGNASLFVSAASLVSISVGPNGLSLALGVPAQLTATGTFSDGSTQDITASVQWSSSNGQFLSISAAGLVNPISVGSANATASMNGVSGSVSVSVTAAVLNSISISATGNSLALGLSEQLSATGTYSDGSTQDITAVVHWNSSNTSILSVNAAGLVLATGAGNASITASLGAVNKTVPLSVSAAILESIAVTAAQNSFALGFTLQLTATGTYSDGSTQDLTAAASWNTNNSGIALISVTGLMSGLSVGTVTATASLQGVSGSASISVSAATLVSISVSPASVSILNILLTQQFTVTGHFSDGSTQTLSNGVHWSCSNALLATINNTGLLTALGVGNLNVTATYGSFTASAAVKIL